MHSRLKRQRLGQHFLADPLVFGRIVSAAGLSKSETVCEVGTGHGDMTRSLCQLAGRVISFEIDRDLAEKARSALAMLSNVEIRNIDPFRSNIEPFDVFVSNLPYSRSRDAIEWLARHRFNRAIVTLQEEFVDKLCAKSGTSSFRAVSSIASFCFKIEPLFKIGRNSFNPPPRVESRVVRLTQINTLDLKTISRINLIFSSRNKLASNLRQEAGRELFSNKRVFQLEPEEIVLIARTMVENVSASRR